MSTDFEDETPIEQAANRDAYYYLGEKLEPFTLGRQLAAQRLAGDGASLLENDILLVFLCTLKPDAIDAARGESGKSTLRAMMNEWAQAKGVSIAMESDPDNAGKMRYASNETREVQRVADEIWRDMTATAFTVKEKKRRPGEKIDAPDPNA